MLVKVICKVCPFQYTECTNTGRNPCPVQPNAPELSEWLKQACTARLCPFTGMDLKQKDYEKHQKWVGSDLAAKELTSKPPPLTGEW